MTLRAVLGGLVGLVILSGCGTSHPGVAAVVNGDEITLDEVDRVTTAQCAALSEQFEAQQEAEREQAEAMGQDWDPSISQVMRENQGQVRTQVLTTLVLRDALERILAENGVQIAEEEYRLDADTLESFSGADDPEARETIGEAGNYLELAIPALLEAWGTDADTPVDPEQFLTRVSDESDITVDPRFGLDENLLPTGSSSVSVAAQDDESGVGAADLASPRTEVTVGRLC